MTRADLWFVETARNPKAALVLCPGMNASGEFMVRDSRWQDFARKNKLALIGLSFASPSGDLFSGHGYTFPEEGSGDILLSAIRKEFGKDLPILLFGFSSGAYFTELFVQWKPERVLAWGAHATGRYEESPREWPPGIVSCGEKDTQRHGAALMHFKKGRAAGGKLLWISLPNCAHQCPEELNQFVRDYFEAILHQRQSTKWVDIDTKRLLTESEALLQPSLSGCLPSNKLLEPWKNIHHP